MVSVLSVTRVRAEEQQENDSVSLSQLPAGALPSLSCTSLASAESRGKRGCGPSLVPAGGSRGRFAHPSHGSRGSKSIPLREENWTAFLKLTWLLKPGLKQPEMTAPVAPGLVASGSTRRSLVGFAAPAGCAGGGHPAGATDRPPRGQAAFVGAGEQWQEAAPSRWHRRAAAAEQTKAEIHGGPFAAAAIGCGRENKNERLVGREAEIRSPGRAIVKLQSVPRVAENKPMHF